MNAYYRRTFIALALLLILVLAAALLANSAAVEAKARAADVAETARGCVDRAAHARRQIEELRAAMSPVREFARAWQPLAILPERDAADRIRAELEAIAQRQLGLVTDNAVTPQPEKLASRGMQVRVQRVTLRASGKDLNALLAWLGKVEETYPAAIVESCEIAANVGANTGLTLRLAQPVGEGFEPSVFTTLAPDVARLPEAISAIDWSRYAPSRVKGPARVGLQRNPLQPGVPADTRLVSAIQESADELRPRIEAALDGRVRSVVRGTSALVVIDGRMFRVGDELVLGKTREKLLAEATVTLKQVAEDRLLLHVSGGNAERPVSGSVTFLLPAFLHAR